MITNVEKEQFLNLLNKKQYIISSQIDPIKDLPQTFNIIIECCLNLDTQKDEKKAQIKKYNLLKKLIKDLYKKNPNYIKDYLYPFNKQSENIVTCPDFIIIIATNSNYSIFTTTSKKFKEDEDLLSENEFYFCFIKFNLKEDSFKLIENNDNVEFSKELKSLQDQLVQQKKEFEDQLLQQKKEFEDKIVQLEDQLVHQKEESEAKIKLLNQEIDTLKNQH